MLNRARLGAAGVVCVAAVGGGCGEPSATVVRTPVGPTAEALVDRAVDKIDLLLVLDNSRSMADKQLILAAAIPDLLGAIINPPCIDSTGAVVAKQPSGPQEVCPAGARRRAIPINDIHVGVVTTSLGGHGSDACPAPETTSCPGGADNTSTNDAGHLLTRQDPCVGGSVPTYQGRGFLAWDPGQKLVPAGERDLGAIQVDPGSGAVSTVTPGLVPTIKDLVLGAGQVGCGYESQLESWYRFLADPDPYESLALLGGVVVRQSWDPVLLKQRADFLRPSSLLAIVLLTDENDCSLTDSGAFFLGLQQRNQADPNQPYHPLRARKECATNPDDPCCAACGQAAEGCPADDACAASPQLGEAEDPLDLRCWDQKRRFGIDFLYPIDRYTQAFTSLSLPSYDGSMVPNPIFSDLDPTDDDATIRDAGLVVLAGIVGVPWQALARDPQDLTRGLKRQIEYSITDAQGHTTWDRILGDPSRRVPPADLHMIESVAPRSGLAPPGSAPDADAVHGHEYTVSGGNDLQYACTFELPSPRDCSAAAPGSCDCEDPSSDSPLCDPSTPTLQVRAKAYPGLRELALLEALGEQAVVASACPAQLTDPSRLDYGYRPAMDLINDRLATAVVGRGCLATALAPDARGLVSCTVVEAQFTQGTCSCDPARARRLVETSELVGSVKSSPLADGRWNCFCEVVPAGDPDSSTPEALAACEGDPSPAPTIATGPSAGKPADGWCYVDPSKNPASSPDLVVGCPSGAQRVLRFVGAGKASPKATQLLVCDGG